MRTRSERRHLDWNKAIHKRNIDRSLHRYSWAQDWYDNLHQYSKGKIHCSCGMCCTKTRNKKYRRRHIHGNQAPNINWSYPDSKKILDMEQQMGEVIDI